MLTRRGAMVVAGLVAVASFYTSVIAGFRVFAGGGGRSAAAWAFQTENPGDLIGYADGVFLGRAGDTSPSRTACSENGQDCLDFSTTAFDVVRGLKGFRRGERVLVERVDQDLLDFDGGRFVRGRQYLLFVKRGEGDTFYQINDGSRFELGAGRLRAAVGRSGVAAFFHGRTVHEIVQVFQSEGIVELP